MPLIIEDPNTGAQVELTSDNTMIFLFTGDDELDHVMVTVDADHHVVCYETQLLQVALAARQFPLVMYPFRPDFAVERRMMNETPDFEHLLDE